MLFGDVQHQPADGLRSYPPELRRCAHIFPKDHPLYEDLTLDAPSESGFHRDQSTNPMSLYSDLQDLRPYIPPASFTENLRRALSRPVLVDGHEYTSVPDGR